MSEGCLNVEVNGDTDDAESVIEDVTMAVEGLADALEDVDAAMRRIEQREVSISIELQPRYASETGDKDE